MPRILVVSGLDFYGYQKDVIPLPRLLRAFGESGWQVDFVTDQKPEWLDKSSRQYGEPSDEVGAGVVVHRVALPLPRRLWSVLGKLRVGRSLRQRLKTQILFPPVVRQAADPLARQADLVYGHEIFGVPIAAALAKKYHKPLVTRFQGTFAWGWLQESRRSPWRAAVSALRYGTHWRALKTPADLIIMTDDGTKGLDVLKILGNHSEVRFWRNGIDLQPSGQPIEMVRNDLSLPAGAKISVSVSRLARWKRVDRIIAALPQVASEIPDLLHVVVGDGSERRHLEEMASSLGVSEHVLFVGSQSLAQVASYLESADVFVSMFEDSNVGSTLLEALRLGSASSHST